MSRTLTSQSNLETLKKEAKRWLKALRDGDADARARLLAATPDAPDVPSLRDIQLALAREHGFPGWTELKRALEDMAITKQERRAIADEILRQATFRGEPEIGARLFALRPDVADLDLYTAVSAGRLETVRTMLAADPEAANRKGGPLGWEPILYLAYMRLPGTDEDAVEIATLLFDAGADPNASWNDGWDNPFKVITGFIGEGEGVKPPHPKAEALVALALARGADPFDTQTFYNTSITFDRTTWLDVLWAEAERRDETERWRKPGPFNIGGKRPQGALDFMLGLAVGNGHLLRATWLLAHGADAGGVHAYTERSHREEASIRGHAGMVALLEHHGAEKTPLSPRAAFQSACFALDRDAARDLAARHPAFLAEAEPMLGAAGAGRADVVALLLELGMDVDVMDREEMRALQTAVMGDRIELVRLLVERGAAVDRPTRRFGGAMGFAAHFKRRAIASYLAPLSRDVHNLVNLGLTDRLAALFAEDPSLPNLRHFRYGFTPLFAIPDDEDEAVRVAEFLLAHGADPALKNKEGRTPGEDARRRGLVEAADVIAGEG
jgi:ankyrin repeat protein